jgi:hypothetical protein
MVINTTDSATVKSLSTYTGSRNQEGTDEPCRNRETVKGPDHAVIWLYLQYYIPIFERTAKLRIVMKCENESQTNVWDKKKRADSFLWNRIVNRIINNNSNRRLVVVNAVIQLI